VLSTYSVDTPPLESCSPAGATPRKSLFLTKVQVPPSADECFSLTSAIKNPVPTKFFGIVKLAYLLASVLTEFSFP